MSKDPDYTGPLFHNSPEEKAAYLTIDNTRISVQQVEFKSAVSTLIADIDDNGNVLGIEVLW